MDNWKQDRSSGDTAFGNFMARHLRSIICGMIAAPFVVILFSRDPDLPVKTVWISDMTTLLSYEARAKFVLDALARNPDDDYSDIALDAPSGDIARFDAHRIDLTKGFPAQGEMRTRVDALNVARERISAMAAARDDSRHLGTEIAERPVP